jgi:ParB/RepB/Spo0J family partition protein
MEEATAINQDVVTMLNMDLIRKNGNYRKHVHKEKQEELNKSVAEKGVLQPILVRTMIEGNNTVVYEIVAGDRRHTAAVKANLKTIPALIRNIPDEDVRFLRLVENIQRDDPNPVDEAYGIRDVLESGKITPDQVAEQLGVSIRYVYARLKLLDLSDNVQKAVLEEKINLSQALAIGRLGLPKEQDAALKNVISEGLTAAAINQRVLSNATELSAAVFDKTECKTCPSRNKNQAILFPDDVKGSDRCLMQSCFIKKTSDHYAAKKKELTEKKIRVLTENEYLEIRNDRRRMLEIDPNGAGPHTKPKRYASQCVPCEHRAYAFVKNYSGHVVEVECCLKPSCFNDMNFPKAKKEEKKKDEKKVSVSDMRQADGMRDRFLWNTVIPNAATNSHTLNRILLYHAYLAIESSRQMCNDLQGDEAASKLALKLWKIKPDVSHSFRMSGDKLARR